MWSDTLLVAERGFLLRLLVWGAASVLAGTGLLGFLALRRRQSPLLSHFAMQSVGWGIVELAIGALALSRAAPRDLAGATRLDRVLWLNAGLDVGYALAGTLAAMVAWRLTRRLDDAGGRSAGIAVIGAGIGIVLQGAALLVLDLHFISVLERLVYHD